MLFVSYASQDRALVDPLVAVLRSTEQQVWLDEELSGGDAWWQTILDRIRNCTVFLVALSNNSLRSKPCQAELAYARALRRPVLPVQIGPVDSVRVTPLAATQIVDYRHRNPAADARLTAALASMSRRAVPLPAPLPEEPTVPFAYLMRLSSDLAGPELSYRKQAELVFELRSRLDEDCDDPTVRSDIVQLLCRLRDRPDVTVRTRTDVDAVLAANHPSFTASTVGIPVAAV
ncbi:MAG: toll/interleukin-1 receptor domain-containing protein, partial [Actinomycetota bacterium]|nr:toll/interleukin-1 receptor domain-containing protein [Actinomycetota bacterium]